MENNDQLKCASELADKLKQQINECDHTLTTWEKAHSESIEEIEAHFAQCVSLLAARKATLLDELDSKLKVQKTKFEEAKASLQISLDGCNELLKSGKALFNTSQDIAETVWKQTTKLPSYKLPPEIIVSFPTTLFALINNHGKVKEYLQSENVPTTSTTPATNSTLVTTPFGSATVFGSATTFGSATAFASAPAFGAATAFGSATHNSTIPTNSAFGTTSPTTSGFGTTKSVFGLARPAFGSP